MSKMTPTKKKKEIIRLLKKIKKASIEENDPKVDRRLKTLDVYLNLYKEKDSQFSRDVFADCDNSDKPAEEKADAVPSYFSGTFRPYMEKYFKGKGKAEQYRIEVLKDAGYKLDLITNEHYKVPSVDKETKPVQEPKSIGKRVLNYLKADGENFLPTIKGVISDPKLASETLSNNIYPSFWGLMAYGIAIILFISIVIHHVNGLYAQPELASVPECVEAIDQLQAKLTSNLSPLMLLANWFISSAGVAMLSLIFMGVFRVAKVKIKLASIFNLHIYFGAVWVPIIVILYRYLLRPLFEQNTIPLLIILLIVIWMFAVYFGTIKEMANTSKTKTFAVLAIVFTLYFGGVAEIFESSPRPSSNCKPTQDNYSLWI